ncbi:Na+/H+ antiporter subunit E [Tropicibacter alexandrii]|uniref:Na+/H+ antiporter subunit E n=1 Tax=Tropicibacter alexandrii TaxID=2267683 RepID=UPI000EF4550B|nr:Na+/H+ antiporter subunit E [Tropicibacter alexandrii]
MKRIFPHPLLSLTLLIVWTLLVNKITLGNLLLGGVLGIVIPILTAAYWPDRAIVKSPLRVAAYILIVVWDIIMASITVARIVLFMRRDKVRSQWITVPLDVTSPEAITVLAGTITMTPGTLTALLSADAGSLLVHCLHTDDPEAEVAGIKSRYEARLKEIFA